MAPSDIHARILVTGGAGFIGSNFISHYLAAYPLCTIVNLDKLTYAGNLDNLSDLPQEADYHFVQGDICDFDLVDSLFEKHQINGVIHFAAESHVDNSINDPKCFIKTNIEGTFTLLEAARKNWLMSPKVFKEGFGQARFHHISTDEVYGSLGSGGFFTESTPYAPNSPYSASKAASDFLARSYFHTYGLNVVITNCSNNYGPKQHNEKLIPTIIRKALAGKKIPIYGDGSNIRDWLYVGDHCTAIAKVYHEGKTGETYAIGGNNEYDNLSIAKKICDMLDAMLPIENVRRQELIHFVQDRPGHDFRYAIDSTKIAKALGWRPKENIDTGLARTLAWYINKYQKV